MVYPSPDEACQIRQIVFRNTTELARLDSEVARAQAVVERLSKQQAETRKCVEIHESLLSPIRKLPPELLAEIFLCSLRAEVFLIPNANLVPLVLLKVCRIWRTIALGTPQLWSSLRIDHAGGNRIWAVENWLSRSGDCPLSLSSSCQTLCTATRAVELIGRYLHRWQHVKIDFPEGYDRNLCLPSPSSSLAPHLTTIDLTCSGRTVAPAVARQIWIVLASAPNLRSVSCDIDPFPPDFQFPWSNLQKLSLLVDVSMDNCLELLKQCPNVVECGFSSLKLASDVREKSPIFLGQLRSLMVATGLNLAPFFDRLCTPALEELAIESFPDTLAGYPVWSQSALLDMLCRSSCPLSKLHFYFVELSPDSLIACLQATESNLTELTIQSPFGFGLCVNDIVLRLLTHRNDDEFRCLSPKLKVLTLLSCISCLEGAFADMVESRWRDISSSSNSPVAQLQVVELRDFRTREDIRRLKKMAKEGLTVNFD